MCLINAAQEHFITQTSKKLEAGLKDFMGPGGQGAEGRHMEPRAEGREKQIPNRLLSKEMWIVLLGVL